MIWSVKLTYAIGVPEELRDGIPELLEDPKTMIVYTRNSTTLIVEVDEASPMAAADAAISKTWEVQNQVFKNVAPEGVEILTAAEVDRRAERVGPRLAHLGDFQEMAGISKARAYQVAKMDGFPKPYMSAPGSLYLRSDLLEFLESWDRRPGGFRKAITEEEKSEAGIHLLKVGGESWCGGHHVRATAKREKATCHGCLDAAIMDAYREVKSED